MEEYHKAQKAYDDAQNKFDAEVKVKQAAINDAYRVAREQRGDTAAYEKALKELSEARRGEKGGRCCDKRDQEKPERKIHWFRR